MKGNALRSGWRALLVLTLVSRASFADAVELLPPFSDVANATHPYVLTWVQQDAAPTGLVRVTVQLQRQPALGRVLTAELAVPLGTTNAMGRREGRVKIVTATLAPGEYRGELRVAGEKEVRPFAFFHMPDIGPPPLPCAIYSMRIPEGTEKQDALLREFQSLGIDLLSPHIIYEWARESKFFDRAARLGMCFRPSLKGIDMHQRFPPIFADGTPLKDGFCLNQPEVRNVAAANVTAQLRQCVTHAGFSDSVYFGDDLFLPVNSRGNTLDVSCYCEHCRADYRAETGENPPIAAAPKAGIVPDNDPWIRWMRYRCQRDFGGLIDRIETAKNTVDPAIRIGLMHGFPGSPFITVRHGLYGPLTQRTGVVSSYCYPFLRLPAEDLIVHYELGRMSNREKELWMLGVLAVGGGTVTPPWQVRQNYWNMLAAGYKTIAYFGWYDMGSLLESPDPAVRRRARESTDALRQCGQHKEWIVPAARYWQLPPAPCALLYSFATDACDVSPVFHEDLHLTRVAAFYRQALAAGLPLDIISEEEVRAGILKQYKVVCLTDVRVLTEDVAASLRKYAGGGKTLLMQPQPAATNLSSLGAREMSPEKIIAFLSDRITRPVVCTNQDVAVRRFVNGVTEHYVVVNNTPDRYLSTPYDYINPAANDHRAALVQDLPVDAELRFHDPERWLFDAATGEALGSTRAPVALHLAPSWGRVLVSLPRPSATLTMQLPAKAMLGSAVKCHLGMRDDQDKLLAGVFSAKVTVITPSGATNSWSHFVGINEGQGDFVLPLGINDETGVWHLEFAGGFPRSTVRRAIRVESVAAERDRQWILPMSTK